MDYGKFKFDAAQRAKESRRKTSSVTLKEMKYRVKIGQGDFDTKTRKVLQFLTEGHKVKITIMFRGRETAHPHLGKDILDRIAEQGANIAKVEAAPKLDGRNMIMVLAPDKRAQAAARSKPSGSETAAAPAAEGRPEGNGRGSGTGTAPADLPAASATAPPADASAPAPTSASPPLQETSDAQDED